MSSIILFGSFFIVLLFGTPISYVLMIATVVYAFFATGDMNLLLVPQRMIYGMNNFTLICLPFFVLAGNIMNHGGITLRLVKMAQAFVGHMRGGLAMVDVLVCLMFGTVSGSAVAGTAAVGSIMIPAMKNEGYPSRFTAGLTAVASTCCPIIPPSLAFVVYGAAAKQSVGDLFVAGIVPGILMAILMLVVVRVYAARNHYTTHPKASWKERMVAIKDALPSIGLPVIVVGGILFGWFTPTEAAVAAVIYALFLSCVVYRTVNLKQLWKSCVDSAIDSGTVMLIVGTCYLFGWVISNERWTILLTEAMVGMEVPLWVKLVLVNLALLVVGMFMDSVPAIMLVAPILAPALEGLGMDPIQVGMIVCMNLTLGLATPPVGVCLYSATNIARCTFGETVRSALPFLLASYCALILITYIPAISQIGSFLTGIIGQ